MKSLENTLDSFGVAGLLNENAHVLYHNIFSTRHIGRITDLIVARLQGNGLDEFKIRTFLSLALSVAYRHQNKMGQEITQPTSIECGIDEEKIALSVSFHLSLNVFLNTEDLPKRVDKNEPSGEFEGYLVEFNKNSDRLILRFNTGDRKIEVTSIMGIKGRIDESFFKNKARLRVVSFDEGQVREAPRPKQYIELGDIGYPSLLGMELNQGGASASPSGEILLPKEDSEEDSEVRLNSQPSENEEIRRFSQGQTGTPSQEVIRVSGQTEDAISDEIIVVTGSKDQAEETRKSRWGGLLSGIKSALKKVSDVASVPGSSSGPSQSPAESLVKSDISSETPSKVLSESSSHLEVQKVESNSSESGMNRLIQDLENVGGDSALENAQKEIAELKAILKDQKAQKMADGLIGNLMKERSRLAQLSKEASLTLRQKDLEFRDKMTALQEESKNKDILISKKDSALEISKSQLSQMNQVIEKMKDSVQDVSSLAQFKHKYQVAQKVLQSTKDENAALIKKVEELRVQLSSAQMARANSKIAPDIAALQTKYERAYRQAEEFKKANRQLVEQLNEAKTKKGPSPTKATPDDQKGRLDAAMKLATLNKKEADTLRTRVAGLLKEEAQLKLTIAQLQAQLKQQASGQSGSSGNTSGSTPKAA